jgi:hypothetical protein
MSIPGNKVDVHCMLQVSPTGNYVATFDKHTLFIWSTKLADKKPLTLHHTKAFTVSAYWSHMIISE